MKQLKIETQSSSEMLQDPVERSNTPQAMLDQLYQMPDSEVQKKIDYYFMPYQRHGELYKFLSFGKEDEELPGGSWKRIQSLLFNNQDAKIRAHIVEHFERQQRIARKIQRNNKRRNFKKGRRPTLAPGTHSAKNSSMDISKIAGLVKKKNKSKSPKLKSPARSPKL